MPVRALSDGDVENQNNENICVECCWLLVVYTVCQRKQNVETDKITEKKNNMKNEWEENISKYKT